MQLKKSSLRQETTRKPLRHSRAGEAHALPGGLQQSVSVIVIYSSSHTNRLLALLFEPVAATLARVEMAGLLLRISRRLLTVRTLFHGVCGCVYDDLCPDWIHFYLALGARPSRTHAVVPMCSIIIACGRDSRAPRLYALRPAFYHCSLAAKGLRCR